MPIMNPVLERASLTVMQLTRLAVTPVSLVRPHVTKRRFQAYAVSLGKSGTHSLAGIFQHYRAAHEPENDTLIPVIIEKWDGWTDAQKAAYVHRRDRRLWLELEASNLLFELTGTLVTEFPEAKFVLTIRDVYSWLDSLFNHNLSRPMPSRWATFADYRTRHFKFLHTPHDEVLADHGLRPLETLLVRWVEHQTHILNTVPIQRLLVIRTADLSYSGPTLAAFLNIPENTLDISQAHLYPSTSKLNLMAKIDPVYLHEKVAEYCGDLMSTYFPHIHSPADALKFEASPDPSLLLTPIGASTTR